jgi:hypothetical protein
MGNRFFPLLPEQQNRLDSKLWKRMDYEKDKRKRGGLKRKGKPKLLHCFIFKNEKSHPFPGWLRL